MELRSYLQVVLRRWRILTYTVLLGMVLGAASSALRTPVYQASTTVLLQPNNPAERVTPDPGGFFDPDRYASEQVTVITGEQVMRLAATRLGMPPADLEDMVSADVGDSSGVVVITAEDPSPQRATSAANAVAEAYIADRKQTEVAALERAAQQIEVQLAALRAQIADLSRDSQARGTGAALQAANLQYTSLFTRQQDLLIDSSLKEGGARVVATATPPTAPIGISLPVSTVLGGLLGAMIGLGLAFLRDHLDDRLRARRQVEELTGHPVLADLPVDRRLSRDSAHLAMLDDSLGPFAESVRALRTSIGFLGVDEPVRRVMVSSAVSGEGKTVVAANLAAAFAQAGSRTLLVSADLRRPRLEALLGGTRSPSGLSTLLVAPAPPVGRRLTPADELGAMREALEGSLVETAVPGVTLLPAGPTPPNPAELLGSTRMDAVLAALDSAFDVIVLDTAPFVPVADAAVLASKVGHVLLVTSVGTSRRRPVERMMDIVRLTDARVLGVVLNRADVSRNLAGGYYDDEPATSRRQIRLTESRTDGDGQRPPGRLDDIFTPSPTP